MNNTPLRAVIGSAAALLAVAVLAAPASAHVSTDPHTVVAGERVVIDLVVGHGCDGHDTTMLEVQIPDGATDPEPDPPEGWTASLDEDDELGTIVVFEGGPLDDHEKGAFPITVTIGEDVEGVLTFPTVQHCGDEEAAWIGDADGDMPAPEVTVLPPGSTVPVDTDDDEADDHGHDHGDETDDHADGATDSEDGAVDDGGTTDETGDEVDDEVPVEELDRATEDADDDGGSSVLPWVIGGLVVVLIAGGAYVFVSKQRDDEDTEA